VKIFLLLLSLFVLTFAQEVKIEVLGSGGPEIDGRASTSYLLWIDNEAKLIVDMGSGSMLRFEESNATIETLEAVVLTHLHIDHSVDLPAFVKAGYFSKRSAALDVIGPYANSSFPSINKFLEGLFGKNGVYRYMQDVLTPQSDSFEIIPVEINSNAVITRKYKSFTLKLINVHHGIVPALGLAILVDGKKIVISGDTDDADKHLEKLLQNADIFIAHHAISEHANSFAKSLHMQPSSIAQIAQKAHVKEILLTHRMNRTFGKEKETLKIMYKIYKGKITFADDRLTRPLP